MEIQVEVKVHVSESDCACIPAKLKLTPWAGISCVQVCFIDPPPLHVIFNLLCNSLFQYVNQSNFVFVGDFNVETSHPLYTHLADSHIFRCFDHRYTFDGLYKCQVNTDHACIVDSGMGIISVLFFFKIAGSHGWLQNL